MFTNTPKIAQISIDDVKKMLDDKEDFVLLDVRTEDEVSRGKIEGSLHIELNDLPTQIQQQLPDKSKKIVAYCLTGSRSLIACDFLNKSGYTDVHNMTHGILAWRGAKYPTTI